MTSLTSQLPPELASQVDEAIASFPGSKPVFESLIQYFVSESTGNQVNSKKRKIEETPAGPASIPETLAGIITSEDQILLHLKDITVICPVRKKLNLLLFRNNDAFSLAATKSINSKPELFIPDIRSSAPFAAITPVPDLKQQSHLILLRNDDANPLVATMTEAAFAKSYSTVPAQRYQLFVLEKFSTAGVTVATSFYDNSGKGKAFYAGAHAGTREGYLYFFPTYILFGMKRPILAFRHEDIKSVVYSTITRHTFSLNLEVVSQEGTKKREFSMIDQEEFPTIDEYIRLHDFNNKSLSEELQAKPQLKQTGYKKSSEEEKNEPETIENADLGNDDDDDEDDGDYEASGSESESDSEGEQNEVGEENSEGEPQSGEDEESDEADDGENTGDDQNAQSEEDISAKHEIGSGGDLNEPEEEDEDDEDEYLYS